NGSAVLAMVDRRSDGLDIQRLGHAGSFKCVLPGRNQNPESGPVRRRHLCPGPLRAAAARQPCSRLHASLEGRISGRNQRDAAGGTPMNADAVSAAVMAPRPAWLSLTWTVAFTT